MTDYLERTFDLNRPELVAVCDELPLWSAPFGLLLLKHVPLEAGVQLLDVGCGTGFPLLELAQRLGPSSRAWGIDPWAEAVNRARDKVQTLGIQNVELVEGDAADLPFQDNQFDLIVSNLGINNLADPPAVLAECHRVARPGGRICLTTNLRGHMCEFYEVFAATLEEMGRREALDRLTEHVNHRTTVKQTRIFLNQAGFAVRTVHEEAYTLRYRDGSALLRHAFIGIAFLPAWRDVLASQDQNPVFRALEANLNRVAESGGRLELTVPAAYIEAEKAEMG